MRIDPSHAYARVLASAQLPCNGLWVRRSNAKALPYFCLTVNLTRLWLTHVTIFRSVRRSFSRFWGVIMRFSGGALRARPRYYVCKECGRFRLAGSIGDQHGCSEAQEKRSKVAKQRKFTSEIQYQRNDGTSIFRETPATTEQRSTNKKD